MFRIENCSDLEIVQILKLFRFLKIFEFQYFFLNADFSYLFFNLKLSEPTTYAKATKKENIKIRVTRPAHPDDAFVRAAVTYAACAE